MLTQEQIHEWETKAYDSSGEANSLKDAKYTFRNMFSIFLDHTISLEYLSKAMQVNQNK